MNVIRLILSTVNMTAFVFFFSFVGVDDAVFVILVLMTLYCRFGVDAVLLGPFGYTLSHVVPLNTLCSFVLTLP